MILVQSERCLELAQVLQDYMVQNKLSISTAESCTGGLVSGIFTHIPGSSEYYQGGVTSYSNQAKINVLGVNRDTLEAHGAVSAETAMEMAIGALKVFNSDFSISITGIAGPGGGSTNKPVGTIFIGLAKAGQSTWKKFSLGDDRLQNRSEISYLALRELIDYTGCNS